MKPGDTYLSMLMLPFSLLDDIETVSVLSAFEYFQCFLQRSGGVALIFL